MKFISNNLCRCLFRPLLYFSYFFSFTRIVPFERRNDPSQQIRARLNSLKVSRENNVESVQDSSQLNCGIDSIKMRRWGGNLSVIHLLERRCYLRELLFKSGLRNQRIKSWLNNLNKELRKQLWYIYIYVRIWWHY